MYTVIEAFNSLSVRGRSQYTADFAAADRQKSGGVRSGERGGHKFLNRCIYCLLERRMQQEKHVPQLKEP
jgi:hypothetical protein